MLDVNNLNKAIKDKDRFRKKTTAIDVNGLGAGKLPPQARELEEAILGAVMLEKGAFNTVSEILKPECFYVEAHCLIYGSMISLVLKNQPIDILTVVEELKFKGQLDAVGGIYAVTKLTNSVISSAHIEAHARIVLQKFIQRELIRISGETIAEAFEDTTDVFDLLNGTEEKIFGVTKNFLKADYKEMGSALTKAMERIDDLRMKDEDISGVASGFPSLDKVTFGWQPTDLIILAARPSVGKTAFALNLARNAALNPSKPVPVGFFSLEMSAAQLVQRILSAESEIEMEKISRGKLEEHEYKQLHAKGIKSLEKAEIFIDDTAALNIFEFRAKARRMVTKNKVGLIIIDYLQLMSGSGDRNSNREQEISTISRNLKALAKDLNVPIIALSQLNRALETRKESKMPQLSDLRESGAIEQDADMVMFIYRPDYHEIQKNPEGEEIKGLTFIRIAKHRNGSLENIRLQAHLHIQKFEDIDSPRPGETFGSGKSFQHSANRDAGFTANKPLGPALSPSKEQDGGKFFVQPSRMNKGGFDEGLDQEKPF